MKSGGGECTRGQLLRHDTATRRSQLRKGSGIGVVVLRSNFLGMMDGIRHLLIASSLEVVVFRTAKHQSSRSHRRLQPASGTPGRNASCHSPCGTSSTISRFSVLDSFVVGVARENLTISTWRLSIQYARTVWLLNSLSTTCQSLSSSLSDFF